MEITLILEDTVADQLRRQAAGTAGSRIRERVDSLGATIGPTFMHPSSDDMARYFSVTGVPSARAEEVAEALRSFPGVAGAFTKPDAEPAGDMAEGRFQQKQTVRW